MDSHSPVRPACSSDNPTPAPAIKLGTFAALRPADHAALRHDGMTDKRPPSYITHHLKLAGRSDTLFSDDAISLIQSSLPWSAAGSQQHAVQASSPPTPAREHRRRIQRPRCRHRSDSRVRTTATTRTPPRQLEHKARRPSRRGFLMATSTSSPRTTPPSSYRTSFNTDSRLRSWSMNSVEQFGTLAGRRKGHLLPPRRSRVPGGG